MFSVNRNKDTIRGDNFWPSVPAHSGVVVIIYYSIHLHYNLLPPPALSGAPV